MSIYQLLQSIKSSLSHSLSPIKQKTQSLSQSLSNQIHSLTPLNSNTLKLKLIQKKLKNLHIIHLSSNSWSISPSFPHSLLAVYQYTKPLKPFFHSFSQNQHHIQHFFVSSFLSQTQKLTLQSLNPKKLQLTLQKYGYPSFHSLVQKKISNFEKSLSQYQTSLIDSSFTQIHQLNSIIHSQIPLILQIFNPHFPNPNSHFSHSKPSSQLLPYLKNFASILYSINPFSDFVKPIKILSLYLQKQIIHPDDIQNFLQILQNLAYQNSIPLLISLIEKNPNFRPIQNHSLIPASKNFVSHLKNTLLLNQKQITQSLIHQNIQSLTLKIIPQFQSSNLQNPLKNHSNLTPIQTLNLFLLHFQNLKLQNTLPHILPHIKLHSPSLYGSLHFKAQQISKIPLIIPTLISSFQSKITPSQKPFSSLQEFKSFHQNLKKINQKIRFILFHLTFLFTSTLTPLQSIPHSPNLSLKKTQKQFSNIIRLLQLCILSIEKNPPPNQINP